MAITAITEDEAQAQILNILNPPQETEAKEEPERAEPETEETAEVEADTQTQEAEASEVEETSETPEPAQEEEGELPTSLTELAEAIEVEPSFLYGLNVKYDLDGDTKEFKLGEIKDIVQKAERIKTESEAIRKSKSDLETERTKLQESFAERLAEAAAIVQSAEKQLQDDFSAADLKQLRHDDPAEYAARVQELNQKQKSLDDLKAKARAQLETTQKEANDAFEKQKAELLQRESAALVEAIPDWKEPERAKAEKVELFKYLTGQGFEAEDVSNVLDHRVFVMARKAMLFDKGQKQVDVSKKKVKTLPKVVKPGAKKSETDVNVERRKLGLQKLKKSGDVKDAASLILEGIKARR